MARKSLLGLKVRRLRQDRGESQVKLAQRLGISPSYLNLIEHNQRSLTLELLLKVSRIFDVDLHSFSEEEEARLLADLDEVFGDPLFRGRALLREDIEGLVASAPELCHAVIALYRAYRNATENVRVLTERMSDDTVLSTATHELLTLLTSIRSFSEILRDNVDIGAGERTRFVGIIAEESERLAEAVGRMLSFTSGEGLTGLLGAKAPNEEVYDLIERFQNYFPEIEEAAAALRQAADRDSGDLRTGLTEVLSRDRSVRVETVAGNRLGAARFHLDEEGRRLLISEALPPASINFLLATVIARGQPEHAFEPTAFEPYISDSLLTTPRSRALCRDMLARYCAAAAIMPYTPFLEAARALRYDIALLLHRFGASFEQVCHRLTTLQKPGDSGVPFHLLRVDIAGNISHRFSASGMRIPRFGGACPRWNVHAAFAQPGAIQRQIALMPDGHAYLCIARTVARPTAGYGAPESHLAIGFGCALSYADQLVYADGMDLENTATVVPVGVNCRLCERMDCQQRAYPPLVRRIRGEEAVDAGA